jgi:hypothetical protein
MSAVTGSILSTRSADMTPHCWAAVLISLAALGFAIAAFSMSLVVMVR